MDKISGKLTLELTPITFAEANQFVKDHHRHHGSVIGHKFSIAISYADKVRGVAMVGRPVSRHLDNGTTLEVNRLCTDGVKNGCSMLYSAAWRAAKALGYKRMITYILGEENGSSLYASNWRLIGETSGGSWNCKARPRIETNHQQKKLLFEAQ